jgi:hypothetical protein
MTKVLRGFGTGVGCYFANCPTSPTRATTRGGDRHDAGRPRG